MYKSNWMHTLFAAAIVFAAATSAIAAGEPIFGWQLMTEQERSQHHQQMLERARRQGVTLPETPPAQGAGRGMGGGQAPGRP